MENDLEFIESFKKDTLDNMAKSLARNGGLDPVIIVLAKHIVDKEFTVLIVPIPNDALKNNEAKQIFAQVIPTLFDKMYDDDLEPICYSWSSEAWLRKVDKDKGIPDNWNDVPKTEALITSFETKDSCTMEIHTIIREGKIANEDGDLIDCISLEKDPELNSGGDQEMEGRFGNVFKNYMKRRKENLKTQN